MNKKDILEKIKTSYNTLLSKDHYLLLVDANERSITHKLAEYLQLEFPEWNVDCEYNRNGIDTKKLDSLKRRIKWNDTNGVSVYPDIIIHHRGTKNNLVVIEAKKSSYTGKNSDIEKLHAYKNDLGYKFAFKVEFPVGDNYGKNVDIASKIEKI